MTHAETWPGENQSPRPNPDMSVHRCVTGVATLLYMVGRDSAGILTLGMGLAEARRGGVAAPDVDVRVDAVVAARREVGMGTEVG
eukprot:26173-Eustigmatos_ZCMA.PRE.1